MMFNNTYSATNSGIEVTFGRDKILMFNKIVMNTSSAALVKRAAGTEEMVSLHGYNLFYSSSTGALSGITANTAEITSSAPLFNNAGAGDFTLSPAPRRRRPATRRAA
jgi:hypothetical protein